MQVVPRSPRLRRLLHPVTGQSPPATLRLLLQRLLLRSEGTPLPVDPRLLPAAVHPFDLACNVDTSGFQHEADLRNAGISTLGSTLWNTSYYGIAPSVFDRALSLATPPPAWSRFTFLDLGCGKGRALLLASRHPFRHILGVELDAALAAIAQGNLRSFQAPWQQSHSLEVLHADATTLDLPLTPLVIYLYNPFRAPVLRRVLRRLERSLHQHPRELWLVYINPEAAHVLRRFPFLREHTRITLPLEPEDALTDRMGSSQEDVALFHFAPSL